MSIDILFVRFSHKLGLSVVSLRPSSPISMATASAFIDVANASVSHESLVVSCCFVMRDTPNGALPALHWNWQGVGASAWF